jgi:hypothetical protein
MFRYQESYRMRSVIRLTGIWLCLLLSACNLDLASNITPSPTPDLPRVVITSPPNNTLVVEEAEFEFEIVARDETAGIAKVELYVDDELINDSSPLDAPAVPVFVVKMNWKAQRIGQHFVEVIPYRLDGTRGDSATLTIEVIPPEE